MPPIWNPYSGVEPRIVLSSMKAPLGEPRELAARLGEVARRRGLAYFRAHVTPRVSATLDRAAAPSHLTPDEKHEDRADDGSDQSGG